MKKKSISELRNSRGELADQAEEINSRYPANSRMPKDVSDQLDGLLDKIDATDREIMAMNAYVQNLTGDGWRDNGGDLKVLRTRADIRTHYSGLQRNQGLMAGAGDEPMRLDDFVRGVSGMRTTGAVQAALSTGTDAAGGFAVPAILMPGILEALVPVSSLLQAGAGIVPLDNGGKSFSTAAINAIPAAQWRAEGGNIAQSEPTFRAVSAVPRSLAFYFKVSRELLADAQNMSAALTIAISQAFAKEIDRAGLRGTGTAPEPRGILNTSGVQPVTNGVNGLALAGYGNLLTSVQSLLQADAPMPTAAIMSPRSLVKLAGLLDTTGQPLMKPAMLEPMKLLSTSQVPNNLVVGSSSDCSEIYMGDFASLVFMMRESISIQLMTEAFATTGEVGFICHARVDVAVLYPAAFAVVTGVRA